MLWADDVRTIHIYGLPPAAALRVIELARKEMDAAKEAK
jgi:hypothetical protein